MQNVSKAYKQSMKAIGRNRGYIRATLGIINSEAQKNAEVNEKTSVTYFSDTSKPFNGYSVDRVYTTAEQDFSKVDGSMYFLPKQASGLQFSYFVTLWLFLSANKGFAVLSPGYMMIVVGCPVL